MNICFIMDPWESIDYENDSTTCIIHEAFVRGHQVGLLCADRLSIRNCTPHGIVRFLKQKEGKISNKPHVFAKSAELVESMVPLAGFDVIFLRANPPLNETMLNFLDTIKDDVFIVNDINGLRKANNKLYPASFHSLDKTLIPQTHVSKNKEYLKKVIEESPHDRMILKPLNSFGGKGVIVIEKSAKNNLNSLLDFYINGPQKKSYVIMQEFVEGAEEGDTRVIILNGEPIGWVRRVPGADDIRSNNSAGGSSVKHEITPKELEICQKIGPKLVEDGLYLVGLDIIKDRIIEINVVSPGGMHIINKFLRRKLQQNIMDFVEGVVKSRELAIRRKLKNRKIVSDG